MRGVRIVIAEDEQVIALELVALLEELGLEVMACFSSGEDLLEHVERWGADLALLDIGLAGRLDGITTAKAVRGAFGVPVVFLTARSDDDTLARVDEVGAEGFVVKPFRERDVSAAVRLALAKTVRRAPAARVPPAAERRRPPPSETPPPAAPRSSSLPGGSGAERIVVKAAAPSRPDVPLSPREEDVLRLFVAGSSVFTMAERLSISPHTVRNHLKSLFRKYGVSSQQELREHLFQDRGGR